MRHLAAAVVALSLAAAVLAVPVPCCSSTAPVGQAIGSPDCCTVVFECPSPPEAALGPAAGDPGARSSGVVVFSGPSLRLGISRSPAPTAARASRGDPASDPPLYRLNAQLLI
jgi:hypothetical protein